MLRLGTPFRAAFRPLVTRCFHSGSAYSPEINSRSNHPASFNIIILKVTQSDFITEPLPSIKNMYVKFLAAFIPWMGIACGESLETDFLGEIAPSFEHREKHISLFVCCGPYAKPT
jgi:hypothetical protein